MAERPNHGVCVVCDYPSENRGNDCVVEHKGKWLCYPCIVAELDAENARLRKAFKRYASHRGDCEVYDDPGMKSCTCGMKAVLAAMESEAKRSHGYA